MAVRPGPTPMRLWCCEPVSSGWGWDRPYRRSGGLLPEHVMETLDLLLVPQDGRLTVTAHRGKDQVPYGCPPRARRRARHEGIRTLHPSRCNARHSEVRTFATTTNSLLRLRDWLVAEQVSIVVMEATGDYWLPPFTCSKTFSTSYRVNAAHARNLAGRKSDVADAVWLAQPAECGLFRASFAPPEPIRQLRDLTRPPQHPSHGTPPRGPPKLRPSRARRRRSGRRSGAWPTWSSACAMLCEGAVRALGRSAVASYRARGGARRTPARLPARPADHR